MALMNRNLNQNISTVFLMPHQKYIHISSSLVKEVASLNGDVSQYVSDHVAKILKEILRQQKAHKVHQFLDISRKHYKLEFPSEIFDMLHKYKQ